MDTNTVGIALEKVRPYLFDFLVENGVIDGERATIKDQFICPNPDHEDTAPSSRILPGGVKGYCHGCLCTFDILHANHWLNQVPASGFGFITNNLVPLCEKYDVEFELGDLSEEDRFKFDSHRAYRLASDYLSAQLWSDELKDYVESRGLTLQDCEELGIACCPDYTRFYEYLNTSFSKVFLREIGFEKASMFSPNSLIFTIKDHTGAPVGFITRYTDHEEKKAVWREGGGIGAPPKKYDASPEKNRIYFKRQVLFGLDYAFANKIRDLYVFEGQFDWAIARASGIEGAVALSGSNFTSDHLALMRRIKTESVTLVLDSDDAGQKALERMLLGNPSDPDDHGMLTTAHFLNIYVLELPEGHDPSSYIAEYGIEAFDSLDRMTSFEWAIAKQEPAMDPVKACERMIPFILAEDNYLKREVMINSLSEAVGLSVKAIEDEIHRKEDAHNKVIEREKNAIAEEALRELRYGESPAEQILRVAQEKIESLDAVNSVSALSIEEVLTALDLQIEEEALLEGPQGFRYGKLKHLEEDLNGECHGTVVAIAGIPNTGKSALMSQLTKELIENNENLIVIAQTIDDNRRQFNRRLAVQWAQEKAEELGLPLAEKITLNKISNPRHFEVSYPHDNQGLQDIRDYGYGRLRDYVRDGRLYIKDTTHGPTLVFLEKLVKKIRKDQPNAEIAIVLDNFHKLQDFPNLDERSSVKKKSQYLKTNIAQGFGSTVFSTFEYKKVETGKRPTNNDLRDAVNIEYDINYLCNLFSELKAAKDTNNENRCDLWHGDQYNKLPIIEGDVGKNKITDLTGKRYFSFFPAQSRFECLSPSDVATIVAHNRNHMMETEGRNVMWQNGKKIELNSTERNVSA